MLIKSVRNFSDDERRAAASTDTFADNLTVTQLTDVIQFSWLIEQRPRRGWKAGRVGNLPALTTWNWWLGITITFLSAVIAGTATALGAAAIANIEYAGSSIQRMQALRTKLKASIESGRDSEATRSAGKHSGYQVNHDRGSGG